MRKLLAFSVLLISTLALAGCFDGSSNRGERFSLPVDFTGFVLLEIDNTNDTREPAPINGTDFTFNDQNNEQAFDRLFVE